MVPGESVRFERAVAPSPQESEVLAAERAWLIAHTIGDAPTLERLMADEYRLVSTDGIPAAKWDVLRSFALERSWDLARSVIDDVRLYGDTAVVFGRYWARGSHNAGPLEFASRYLAVWVRRAGRWQIVADQATPMDEGRL